MLKRLFVLLICLAGFARAEGEISVSVQVSTPSVYLGESFDLTVNVNGVDDPSSKPDVSALSSWADVAFVSSKSQSMRSIQVINGVRKEDNFFGRIFHYRVRPAKAGSFTAGPVQISIKGKTYRNAGRAIVVTGPVAQNIVAISVEPSSEKVLVEEPFKITLKIRARSLSGEYSAKEPIVIQYPPHIEAPFLEISSADPKRIKGPDVNSLLSNMRSEALQHTSAFTINNYETQDIFGGFGDLFGDPSPRSRKMRFHFPHTEVSDGGTNWHEYAVTLDYVPKAEGEYTFGPVSFKGAVIDPDALKLRQIYTLGNAATVRVEPPPEDGRPESFIGSVGSNLTANAAFDASVCKVGDPLTLTLEVKGDITLSNMHAPALNSQHNLTGDFRIYDESVKTDTLPDGKRFQYKVRPKRAGTLEFPPVEISWFDTLVRKYATVRTEPIPVQAQATTQIATDEEDTPEEHSAANAAPRANGVTLSPKGIENTSLLQGRVAAKWLWLAFVLAPIPALLTLVAGPFVRVFSKLRDTLRENSSLGVALKKFGKANTPSELASALRNYLARRCKVQGSSLTPAETKSLLLSKGCTEELAGNCRDTLAELDEALYRPDAKIDCKTVAAKLRELLPKIDRMIALLLLLFALPLSAAQDGNATRSFLWEQGLSQAASGEYIGAADTWNRIAVDGVSNAPLFLNIGEVLLMAGDGANAEAAFRRSERFTGANADTRSGIATAIALKNEASRADLPWTRTAFFWHYSLACHTRLMVALAGWLVLWLGMFMKLKRLKGGTALIAMGTMLCVVFAVSVSVDLLCEKHDASLWASRVFAAHTEGGDAI